MPRQPPAPAVGVGIILPLVVILISVSVLLIPLTPSISATFSIQTTESGVGLTLNTVSYSKLTLLGSLPTQTNGSIILPVRPIQQGSYELTIQITNSNSLIADQTFGQIGDGVYVFKAAFFLRQDSSTIPYLITLTLSGSSIQTTSINFSILPS